MFCIVGLKILCISTHHIFATVHPEVHFSYILIYQAEDAEEQEVVNLQLAQLMLHWGLLLMSWAMFELLFDKFSATEVLRGVKWNC